MNNKKNLNTFIIPWNIDNEFDFPSVKNQYIEVENKPYKINTVFFVGNENKLKSELIKRENIDIEGFAIVNDKSFSGITIECTRDDGSMFVLIWMPVFEWKLNDFETLSHECLHAAIMVMRLSGVKARIFSAEDDETTDDEGVCYSQSSMFKSILSELSKRQLKIYKKKVKAV